jgi:DNA (cytosine-5)-methyltransferase 1
MFIYENVKGILNHKKGETFNYIYSKFEELNYHMEKSILNAKDYGIPQNRERLFIIGYKNHCFKDMNVIQKMISNKIQQTLIVKDFLDENIEEKYYIKSQLWQKYITNDYQLGKSKVSINPKTAICLTARQYANWAGNYLLCFKNDKINFDLNDEVVERIKDLNILSYDINYIKHNLIFRRLTPKEILKLMGYDTNIFKTYVSDAQTYKQAGNSIVSSIFENMIPYILDIWIS